MSEPRTLASSFGVPAEALEAARALAWRAAESGRPDLARTLAEGAVALDPSDGWSWRLLAVLALRSGDAGAAQRAASEAFRLAQASGDVPAQATVALSLARALLAGGDRPGAAQWLRWIAALESAPREIRSAAVSVLRRVEMGSAGDPIEAKRA